MAEGERKKLAELYFEYSKALQGLTEIDRKLKEVSEHSETYFNKLGKNLDSIFIKFKQHQILKIIPIFQN